jgi:O-antigen/teichoic acid export membrane protein
MKILQNKVFKNFSVLAGANLIIQVLSILSSIRLARQLQPDGYGLFNLINVQASIFGIIAAYGLRVVVIRHVARLKEDARRIFQLTNHIRAFTTIIAITAALVYNSVLSDHSLSNTYLLLFLAEIMQNIF